MASNLVLERFLERYTCQACGETLKGSKVVSMFKAPQTFTAYITCGNCRAESMATLSPGREGISSIKTDLKAEELKNFLGKDQLSREDVLDAYVEVEQRWKQSKQKKGKSQAKKSNA